VNSDGTQKKVAIAGGTQIKMDSDGSVTLSTNKQKVAEFMEQIVEMSKSDQKILKTPKNADPKGKLESDSKGKPGNDSPCKMQ